jgi:hypothetical protein
MNNRQLFLAWLRTTAPETYTTALRKVAGKPRGSGGLTRDLIGSMYTPSTGFGFLGDDFGSLGQDNTGVADGGLVSNPLETVTVTPSPDWVYNPADYQPAPPVALVDTSTFTTPAIEATPPPALDTSGTLVSIPAPAPSAWGSFLTAVTGLASTALTTSAQSNLVKVNTARAAQGLPPVDANGIPIRPTASLFPPNTTIARLESSIAGVATSPLFLIAGVGLLALFFMRKRA